MGENELNGYGNVTLGEIADFVFTMLGSFCEENGIETKIRNDYINKSNKTEFSKYNLTDGKSDISKLLSKFKTICFKEMNAFLPETNFLLYFPVAMSSQISNFYMSYRYAKTMEMQIFVSYYLAYVENRVEEMVSETYKSILGCYKEFDVADLSEKAKWNTVYDLLQNVQEIESKNKKECTQKIIRHYVFLGFKKALIEVFCMEESLENTLKSFIENAKNMPFVNAPDVVFDSDARLVEYDTEEKQNKSAVLDNVIKKITPYFITDYSQIKYDEAVRKYDSFLTCGDEPTAMFLRNWCKARTLIFMLKFDGSDEDEKNQQEALELFRKNFDEYKYFAGINLPEFISDAIVTDVYLNRKKITDVLDNAQDNTGESSILKPGKTYWEFAYAVGILEEDSQKTYLASYNAEKNFWTNFTLPKFCHMENAKNKCAEEITNEELNFPNLVQNISKKRADNLLSIKNTKMREKVGKNYYSNLSVAIARAENETDFTSIATFIKNSDAEKLFKNDECGATPFVRALHEYKNCVYGFTKEFRQHRAKLLYEFDRDYYTKQLDCIIGKYHDVCTLQVEWEQQKAIAEQLRGEFTIKYTDFMNKDFHSPENTKTQCEALKTRAGKIKESVIKPLLEKLSENVPSKNHILDEAIQLDVRHCVSALQLAIDSYDAELVKLIVDNLPESNNDLSKIYISEEFATPLQYAIRKYDLLMQYCAMYGNELSPLNHREIPKRRIITKGILLVDKIFYDQQNFLATFTKIFPVEECGITLSPIPKDKNIVCQEQKKLFEIITYLAEKTKPISVDNFYYLSDIRYGKIGIAVKMYLIWQGFC